MTLRIAVITDIHYGFDVGAKKGSQALPLLDGFLDAAQNFNADYIFNLGDEVSTKAPATDDKHKQTLRHAFKRAACPVIKIDGNHCVRYQEKQSPSRSFDAGDHHIIMWNPYMNRYTRDGVIPDPEDIEWLQNTLAQAVKPTILLSHIPFGGPESVKKQKKRIMTDGLYYPSHFAETEKLREMIEASGKVILCLSGHRHLNDIRESNGVHYLIHQSLVEVVQDDKPAGAFSMIEVAKNEIRIKGYGLKQPPLTTLPLAAKPALKIA